MNDNIQKEVITLPPFKRFCMTIGELPSSYVETMTYYEMVLWFTKYLGDTIIPTVNNNAEAVTELQNLFVELQSYVNNYFDNLDVQEEINNKLDEMAESGQLVDIIAQYLQLAGVLSFDTVSDMKVAQNLTNGSSAKTLGYHNINDGGGTSYKIRTKTIDDVIDEGSLIELENNLVAEICISGDDLRPEHFGAYGDGIHDDSDALQNYINYNGTGVNIYLSTTKTVYRITKQIDLKEKGIVGNGFSAQEQTYYNINSILVDDGDYTNEVTSLNNIALINVGRDIRNIQLVASNSLDNDISGMLVHGYNTNINNINITGFYDQIIVPLITVSFRVNNLMSISNKHSGIHILDTQSSQSTTAYFDKCSWQWGEYSILFDKEVYGSSFTNIVCEHMKYGFKAQSFIYCIFNNIWFEETSSEEANPSWITTTDSQQLVNNIYECLYIRAPWFNPANTSDIAPTQNGGGVAIDNSKIATMSSTGKKVILDNSGIHTAHAKWLARASRKFKITTQPTAEDSGYVTDLYISAPNNCLWFDNHLETDHTPVVIKKLIGEDSSQNAYFGNDNYTKEKKTWTTHDNQSDTNGWFTAPMFLTYSSHRNTNPKNNGWEIVENNDNTFTFQRMANVTKTLTDPHIMISGIVTGSGVLGDSYTCFPAIQIIESYSGSYSSYGVLKGFKITFRNTTGDIVKPKRFTVAFTSTNS